MSAPNSTRSIAGAMAAVVCTALAGAPGNAQGQERQPSAPAADA